jgi:hypothetical protein
MKKITTIGALFTVSTLSVLSALEPVYHVGPSQRANPSGVLGILKTLSEVIDASVPILIGLGVLGLFWYLFKFVWSGAHNPSVRKEALKGVGMSLIAILVMVSLWGIILFMANTLGLDLRTPQPPTSPLNYPGR